MSSVQALPSLHGLMPGTHAPPEHTSGDVHGFPSSHAFVLATCVHAKFTQASSVQTLLSLQSAADWQMVTRSRHHPLMLPPSGLNWSSTHRFHVPFGLLPVKTESADPPSGTGAGAGQTSPVPTLVGLNVPETSGPASGMDDAAESASTRFTPVTAVPPPTSDMMIAFWPAGPASRTSMSSGNVWVMPFSLTVAEHRYDWAPEMLIGAGYGVAAPTVGIEIKLRLQISIGGGVGPGTQTPPEQTSPFVQTLLSVHVLASLAVCTHAWLTHASSVHVLLSLQSATVSHRLSFTPMFSLKLLPGDSSVQGPVFSVVEK